VFGSELRGFETIATESTMDRVRIIHVVHSLGTGGTEEGVRKLLVGLDSRRFEQIVCSVAPAPAIEPRSGARVISLGHIADKKGFFIRKLEHIFRRECPDIVHSRNWGAIEAIPAARLAGVKAVIHSEHGLEASMHRRQPLRRNVVRRLCFCLADRVFTVSLGLRAFYVEQLRIPADRILVLPNGVDIDRFRLQLEARSAMRQALNVSPETLVVGIVGRLDLVKDHRTLFEGVERVVSEGLPLRLIIVGNGPERMALEEHVRRRSLISSRTTFVGETSDVALQLNSFDVFALPSLAEGMSNALLEAMAVGVAPVATRVGGNSELIEEGVSGLLFEVGDAKTLADHLRVLASDAELRRSLGLNARKRVEHAFSLRRMLNNYACLYEETIGNGKADSATLNSVPAVRAWSE